MIHALVPGGAERCWGEVGDCEVDEGIAFGVGALAGEAVDGGVDVAGVPGAGVEGKVTLDVGAVRIPQ